MLFALHHIITGINLTFLLVYFELLPNYEIYHHAVGFIYFDTSKKLYVHYIMHFLSPVIQEIIYRVSVDRSFPS